MSRRRWAVGVFIGDRPGSVVVDVSPLKLLGDCMIEFSSLKDLLFDEIEFRLIDVSRVGEPKPISNNKYLNRPEYDSSACLKQMLQALNIDPDQTYNLIMIVNLVGGTPEVFGFEYSVDRLISPFRFSDSKHFSRIVDVLLEPFSGAEPTLLRYSRIVNAHETGGGCSRSLVDIDAFIKEPGQVLKTHAPAVYFDSKYENRLLPAIRFLEEYIELNSSLPSQQEFQVWADSNKLSTLVLRGRSHQYASERGASQENDYMVGAPRHSWYHYYKSWDKKYVDASDERVD